MGIGGANLPGCSVFDTGRRVLYDAVRWEQHPRRLLSGRQPQLAL